MNESAAPPPEGAVPIRTVERDTGLSKDILRVWERRYGFPTPTRDASGGRAYPPEQIAKLRLIRRLVDAGQRPGRIVTLPLEDLERLVQDAASPAAPDVPAEGEGPGALERCMELLTRHDATGLSRHLREACLRLGLERFITDLVAPLTTQIGDAWMRGRLAIFQEHLFSESLQGVLRGATARMPEPPADARPRVLLTTFVDEPHGLGLLMAQGLLALAGAHCVSLGVGTPVWDIAQAAKVLRSDVVALSFTGSMNPAPMVEGLKDLRAQLPPETELWAGGAAPALHRRAIPGVIAMSTLQQVHGHVQRWRSGRSA